MGVGGIMGSLIERKKKIMMMQGQGLPPGYRQIEWLGSTGTQYFWTDIKLQDGLTVESKQTFKSADSYLFGAIYSTSSGRYSSCFNGNYRLSIQGSYPTDYYLISSEIQDYNTPYVIRSTHENGRLTVYKDGVLIRNSLRGDPISDFDVYCVMFGARRGNGTVFQKYVGEVYQAKVYKGNKLLANYIPCIRKSDDKPGMYDTVGKKFYTNEGTGEFTVPQ